MPKGLQLLRLRRGVDKRRGADGIPLLAPQELHGRCCLSHLDHPDLRDIGRSLTGVDLGTDCWADPIRDPAVARLN